MHEIAYAKINLALHVRGRRADGYHELETLFAFVDVGDELHFEPGEADGLTINGEFAGNLAGEGGNIVLDALAALPHKTPLHITLAKNLPVAAGLGGGSADAGAVFRALENGRVLPKNWPEIAARLGADVPACVRSVTCIGRGIGAELEPISSDLTGTPILLVNPRIPLATGPVFKNWDGVDRGAMPIGSVSEIARKGRNDLEAPAIALCPVIGEVLTALNGTSPWLARMSGSGATCFALYDDDKARDKAADVIAAEQPEWWQKKGNLR